MELQFTTLLLCYGLMFGFQNKVPFLYGKSAWVDKLLQCSYCLGFHCGWIAWIFMFGILGFPEIPLVPAISSILIYAFSSSAFCYITDALVQLVESHTLVDEE